MEKLKIQYKSLCDALETLHTSLKTIEMPEYAQIYDQIRDSVIQRFEYSIEC